MVDELLEQVEEIGDSVAARFGVLGCEMTDGELTS